MEDITENVLSSSFALRHQLWGSSSLPILPFVYTPNERFHVVSSVQLCIIFLDFWGQGSVTSGLLGCWSGSSGISRTLNLAQKASKF